MVMSNLKYDYEFDPEAQNNTAASIARFAMLGGKDVLDIGAGPAIVSRYLASQGREATCLDNDDDALASLDGTGLRTIHADLESESWADELIGQSFDVIILADVLEHLRQPLTILDSIRDQVLLREDGLLVVSVPNASHVSVVSELFVGEFDYTKTGILDETHVRWFTLHNLTTLLEAAGFVVDRVERTRRSLEQTGSAVHAMTISEPVRRELSARNPESETYQFVVLARPDNAANRIAAERSRFAEERRAWREEREAWSRQLAEAAASETSPTHQNLSAENERLRKELVRVRAILQDERQATRADLKLGAAEMSRVHGRARDLKEVLQKVKRERQEARDSLRQARETIKRLRLRIARQDEELERLRDTFESSRGVRAAAKVVKVVRRAKTGGGHD